MRFTIQTNHAIQTKTKNRGVVNKTVLIEFAVSADQIIKVENIKSHKCIDLTKYIHIKYSLSTGNNPQKLRKKQEELKKRIVSILMTSV